MNQWAYELSVYGIIRIFKANLSTFNLKFSNRSTLSLRTTTTRVSCREINHRRTFKWKGTLPVSYSALWFHKAQVPKPYKSKPSLQSSSTLVTLLLTETQVQSECRPCIYLHKYQQCHILPKCLILILCPFYVTLTLNQCHELKGELVK